MTSKRPVGRPALFDEPVERRTVRLPPAVISKLTKHGDGSLSAGIVKAAKKVKP